MNARVAMNEAWAKLKWGNGWISLNINPRILTWKW